MIKDLLKLADNLDRAGFHKEADDLTKLVNSDRYVKAQEQKSISPVGAIGTAAVANITGAVMFSTIINKGLEKVGFNDAVINWLLQPNLKNGIKYRVGIDTSSIDPDLLKDAVAFVPYGVSGILMKGSQIVNKNSTAAFPNVNPVNLSQVAEVTLPQNQNGILIPTSVVASIIYSDGRRRSAISTPESTTFAAGTNVVTAIIKTIARSAR
jgi:hypothetical protein